MESNVKTSGRHYGPRKSLYTYACICKCHGPNHLLETYKNCEDCFREHASYEDIVERSRKNMLDKSKIAPLSVHAKLSSGESHRNNDILNYLDVQAIKKSQVTTKNSGQKVYSCDTCGVHVGKNVRVAQRGKFNISKGRYIGLRCLSHLEEQYIDVFIQKKRDRDAKKVKK